MEIRADLSDCPHCGGKTALQKDARLRFVCAACGGPRVPGGPAKSRALVKARALQAAAFGWSAGAIALALTGALLAGLAALVWTAASGPAIAVAAVSTLLFLFAWRASARAGARRKELSAQVEQAWREGARAVLEGRGRETTAAELAEAMKIDETDADELLTELAAHDEARVAIDTGDVKYRIDSAREREELEAESSELEHKRRL